MRRFPAALVLACVTYLVHRALVLHSNFDSVAIPNYELSAMGNIAWVLHEGWRGVPLFQFYDNCGGHLAVGVLAAPLYALFGPSYLTLKLVPVLLGLGCIPLLWSIGRRLFGPVAGAVAAWLFVLGPPTLTKYSMLAKGNHFENVFFQLFVVWAFVRMHQAPRKEAWLPIFALASGFAVFFYFGSALMVALLFALHFVIRFGWRLSPGALVRPLRDAAIGIVPFFIGLLPLYLIQSANQRPGVYVSSWFLEEGIQQGFVAQLRDLVLDLLPRATVYEDLGPVPGAFADRASLALFTVAWLTGAGILVVATARLLGSGSGAAQESGPAGVDGLSAEDRAEAARFRALRLAPFVAYLPGLMLVYGLSSLDFDAYGPPVEVGQFRYLVPHFAFATLLVGGVVALLHASGRPFGRGIAGLLVATGGGLGLFVLPLVDWSFERAGLGFDYPGYSQTEYRNALLRDTRRDEATGVVTWDFAAVRRHMLQFPLPDQQAIARGIGDYFGLAQSVGGIVDGRLVTPPFFDLPKLLAPFPEPELRVDVARGAGAFLRRSMADPARGTAALRGRLEALAASGDPMGEYVVEGLCLESLYPLVLSTEQRLARSASMGPAVPEPFAPAWRRGQGIQIGDTLRRGHSPDLARARAVAGAIPEDAAAHFWLGVGMGLTFEGDVPDADDPWAALVPDAYRATVWRGVGAGLRHALGEDASLGLVPELAGALASDAADALADGARWASYPAPFPGPG